MELAKITSKGQITIPIQIRRKLNLKDGDKVIFLMDGGKVIMDNPARLAKKEAQDSFKGLAEELELESEEDVINLVKEVRKEMWAKKHANTD